MQHGYKIVSEQITETPAFRIRYAINLSSSRIFGHIQWVLDSPADWCKNWGFWVKGTKVGTIVACDILNEIG